MNRITISFIAAAIVATGLTGPDVAAADHRPAAPVCPSYRTNDQYPIRLCDKGDDVKSIQTRLRSVDSALSIDGYFGPATLRAAREFQRINGLEVDGLVGAATWSALAAGRNGTDNDGSGIVDPDESTYGQLSPPATTCARYRTNDQYPIRLCDKGPAVLVAQAFVWAFEHNLEIDGYFGPQTDVAVRNYQSHNGLEVDGLIGPRTWRAITSGFTCGTDDDQSGLIDPDEIDRSPRDFPDFYAFLIECFGSTTVN